MTNKHNSNDVSVLKKEFERKVNGSNDAFCSVLKKISDKYVADFILEASEKNLITEIKSWLLFEGGTTEAFFSNHSGVISFEMIRQSMYEMASDINDEVFDLYNRDENIDLSKLDDQDSFEIRKIIEWAKEHTLS